LASAIFLSFWKKVIVAPWIRLSVVAFFTVPLSTNFEFSGLNEKPMRPMRNKIMVLFNMGLICILE
jgi:hypothetical protein